ncbi:MAG: DUF554 domain-containing protein, partial [Defluviitaleaceae bacterium]|nr:DUF554 domain-containing protein [Defluviitaleaceae bacterium]
MSGGTIIRITGSLVNAALILAGGAVGLLLKGRIKENMGAGIARAIGLCVCVIGVSGAIKGDSMLLVASMALGCLTGELANIEGWLGRFGMWLQRKLTRGNEKSSFAEGFVAATLLFCVGAMAIIGSI